ncbi:MAG: nudix hydrolase [Wendovervirus sonii]|uniref:Nudix hydrolase n=1 Tax=phage Lak_Megaphage_Sonny TaxID=3109229 RepID=A0ABZ0Z3R5_9CAUD|nr:MAG: nudix hydrolase [phage Lak_Megaphage_Sonny]
MDKQLSCGFIVEYDGKFLACHASGRNFEKCTYDIAKGHNEEGENHLETAKRELKEETGIDLDNADFEYDIVDFGIQQYIKTKDLHIYMLKVKNINHPFDLKCTTYFEVDGKQIPEINGYEWTDDITLFFKSLQNIFNRLKSEGKLNF